MGDIKYCGNLFLGENEEKLWQNLYSSQSYQSFYSIFANLESSVPNEDSLTKMELKIFNYKGLLDLAFFKDKSDTSNPYHKGYSIKMATSPEEIQKETGYEEHVELIVYVCAKFSKQDAEEDLRISEEDLNGIKVGDGQMIMVKRQTISFNGMSGEEIKHLNNDVIENIHADLKRTGVYDEEFYLRNGKLYRKKVDTDGSLLKENIKGIKDFSVSMFNGNPSCHNIPLYFRHK